MSVPACTSCFYHFFPSARPGAHQTLQEPRSEAAIRMSTGRKHSCYLICTLIARPAPALHLGLHSRAEHNAGSLAISNSKKVKCRKQGNPLAFAAAITCTSLKSIIHGTICYFPEAWLGNWRSLSQAGVANPTAAHLGTAEGSGASSREASTHLPLRETAKEKTACVFLYVQTEHVHTHTDLFI